MTIYTKENFQDLPDYFWTYWLERLKKEIISTGYPLFLIRVGICEKSLAAKLHQEMWNLREEKNDHTFCDFFYHENECIMVGLNTIFDYAEMSINDIEKTL
jgi:hypothetical protein